MCIFYSANFDAPDAHFDKLCLFTVMLRLAKSFGNPKCYEGGTIGKPKTGGHDNNCNYKYYDIIDKFWKADIKDFSKGRF
jgi:hypothetical protein